MATIPIATPLGPENDSNELLWWRPGRPALAIDVGFEWATQPEEKAVVQVDPQMNTVVATIALVANATSIAVDGSSL